MGIKYILILLILNLALSFQEVRMPAVADIKVVKPVRIMAVGKSGVGKSTIGNFVLGADPGEGPFKTSPNAESCTQSPEWRTGEDNFVFCDVPGIPDTNADNTKDFYNAIIEEAKKELNVILFVFKYERIDNAANKKARLLFRELKKANAIKVLIINDMNNYAFGPPPTEEEYQKIEQEITESTGLQFAHKISVTAHTMKQKINTLKLFFSKSTSAPSPELKTFTELGRYVEALLKLKNYEETVLREAKQELKWLDGKLTAAALTCIGSGFTTAGLSVASFFTLGATATLIGASTAATITSCGYGTVVQGQFDAAKAQLNPDNVIVAQQLLEEATLSFKQLEKELTRVHDDL